MGRATIKARLLDSMGCHDAMFFLFLPVRGDYSPSAGCIQCTDSPIPGQCGDRPPGKPIGQQSLSLPLKDGPFRRGNRGDHGYNWRPPLPSGGGGCIYESERNLAGALLHLLQRQGFDQGKVCADHQTGPPRFWPPRGAIHWVQLPNRGSHSGRSGRSGGLVHHDAREMEQCCLPPIHPTPKMELAAATARLSRCSSLA